MDTLRSSAEAPLPTHTKTSEPRSSRKTSVVSSIDFFSAPDATSVVAIEPVASLTLSSFGAHLPASTASSETGALTAPLPPSVSQKTSGSAPCSHALMTHLPPRSSSLIDLVTSSALAFSFLLHSAPFHWMISLDMTRTKTSPELSDDAESGTGETRTTRLPLICSSCGSCTPRSTLLKPDATPPLRYCTDLKHWRNCSDS
mmetsp:Transcript_19427/g.33043  ORF Transcript_19427/g.33043 Transcript_19427/m.33043 type:complete len:201 (-) Transcript_19427:326-928(-)